MPDAVPSPTTTPAPSREERTNSAYDAALASMGGEDNPVVETPAAKPTTEPAPAASPAAAAAAKRIAKYKIDHEEKELDWDETWSDESKRTAHINAFQRGLNADREVARERQAAVKKYGEEIVNRINEQGYDVVKDPSHPSGWKIVQRQATTPPADTDPLTTEETQLRALAEEDRLNAKGQVRLAEIIFEKKALARQKAEAEATARAAAAASAAEAERNGNAALTAEIEKTLVARVKSFEGPDKDRRTARVKALALNAAQATAASLQRGDPQGWDKILAAALAVVKEEADDLDLRAKAWVDSATANPAKPAAMPVVGTPSGGGGRKKLTDDEKYAEALASINS